MRRRVAYFLCFILALLLSEPLFATRRLNFTNYRAEQGLSSNYVCELTSDSHGFLWIATDYGLNRFDGAVFRNYLTENYNSLNRNDVLCVCAARPDEILVSGYNGFFQKYDYKTDRFDSFFPADFYLTVGYLNYDAKGDRVFALTSDGVYLCNTKEQKFVSMTSPNLNTLTDIQTVMVDQLGRFWVCTLQCLYVFSPSGKQICSFPSSSSIDQTFYPQLLDLGDGRLMACYNKNQIDVFKVTADGKIEHQKSVKVPFTNLRRVQKAVDGSFWMATDGNGLWRSQTEPSSPNDFEKIMPFGASDEEFSKIYALYADQKGNVWVGTQNTGLWCYSVHGFSSAFSAADLGLPRTLANGFAQTKSGSMLVACDGLGLCEFTENGELRTIYNESAGLTTINLTGVTTDASGRVYVPTWGGGLFEAQSGSGKMHFSNIGFTGVDKPQSNMTNLTVMSTGDLWASVGGDGLYIQHNGIWARQYLKYEGGGFERWPGISLEGPNHEHWLSASCSMWKEENGQLVTFDEKKFSSSPLYSVADLVAMPDYGLIVGTRSGLYVTKSGQKSFEQMPICQGKAIHCLVVDLKGRLWAVVENSIWCFDLKKNTGTRYPMNFDSHGKNFFINHSKFCSKSGRLYFGTKEGFISLNPDNLKPDANSTTLCLNRLEVDGARVDWPSLFSGEPSQSIDLDYGHSSFAISVDAPDFTNHRPSIVYKLDDEDWKTIGLDQRIAFSYLPSGSHKLLVKTIDADDASAIALTIDVASPWWATWWFRLLCVALVVGLVGWKLTEVTRDRKILKMLVDERTEELKQKNELVEKQNEELNAALTTKDRLMAVVAHDLKNPVFAIVGALEGLRSNENMSAAERNSLLDKMIGRSHTLQDELGKMLTWATSKQTEMAYRPSNSNLAEIISSDVELLRMQAEEKGVQISCDVNTPYYVYVDSRMMSTAIRNVIGNSIKFTPSGKAVAIRAWQKDGKAFVEVSDQGEGIPADKLHELLSKDVNSSTEGTNGEKGTGLGVGFAKYYTQTNGGRFTMTSELGKGSVTLFELPSTNIEVPVASSAETLTETSVTIDAELLQGNCILVVDDDPLIAQNVKSMLETYTEVLVAKNGQEALDLVHSNNVDIVVSDVEMPVMNGIDMSKALAADDNYNHIPILFLSAKTTESDRLLGLLTGAIDYIPKPFSRTELLVKLCNILSLRQRQQQRLLSEAVQKPVVNGGEASLDLQEPKTKPEEKINPYLKQVLAAIEKNFGNADYGVEELASDLCTTRVTLYRKVKSLSGRTPIDLLNDYRLNQAKQMLESGDVSLHDVPFKTGFSDYTYFARRFKAHFGSSPSESVSK